MRGTPTVLVVDDEPAVADFLKDYLEDNGFAVMLAPNGKAGMALALEKSPDVILLDVELPDTDGYALCRSMRQKTMLRNKPILMLTVKSDQRNELMGLKAGADDYLTKPVNTARLLARLNAAIHRNIRELDASPLTHLPGNTSIAQELEKLLAGGELFAVMYADLNNFKAFNDRYGFMRGDQAIKLAAQCIVSGVEQLGNGATPTFVGHVGGDDFVAVVPAAKAEPTARRILTAFDAKIPSLYDEEDRQKGYILMKNRQGQPVETPVMSLSLVIVRSDDRVFQHPGEISALASELKNWAKSYGKSVYVTNRRKTSEDKA